ncbi:MAG: alpha/beta hydrolase-fold protein [Chloroflexota bacterium]|nr:alpha/beta hydrolase-fold protein [Chloroflexota bacterium]
MAAVERRARGRRERAPERGDLACAAIDTFTFTSHRIGEPFRIAAEVPPGKGPFRAVYVLDPVLNLAPTIASIRYLATGAMIAGAELPELAVIGIEHAVDIHDLMGRRGRDFTPTPGARSFVHFPGAGAAPRFLEALEHELIPAAERRLRLSTRRRILVGHSLGGLFGLHVLFNRPSLFDGYILVGPSIWWDDRSVLAEEERWSHEHDDLDAHVFLAAGANEERVGDTWKNEGFPLEMLRIARQAENVRELAARLRARRYPRLTVDDVIFDGEYHFTVMPSAITRGLLTLLETPDRTPLGSPLHEPATD